MDAKTLTFVESLVDDMRAALLELKLIQEDMKNNAFLDRSDDIQQELSEVEDNLVKILSALDELDEVLLQESHNGT